MEIGINGKVCGGGDNISTSCTGDHNQYADETVDTVDLSHNNIRPTPIVVVVVDNNNNNNNNNNDSNDNNNVNNNGNKNGNNNSNNNGNSSSNDDDVHDNVQKGLTDLRDLRTRWASVDQRQLKLGRHKRPIVPIGDMLSETLRARVVPPNRVEKITRDDSATQVRCTAAAAAATTSTVGERSRARSLPSRRLFSRNISYQQKIEPLGTAKGRRTLEQRPVPGRSSSVHDISTEIESASALAKAEIRDGQNQLSWYEDNDDDRAAAAAVRAAVVAECRRRFSALNLHANDEIVLTTLNVSLGPTTTTTDDNGNLRMGRNSLTTSIVREPTIVPSQCHLCYDELKRAEPVTLDDVTSPVTRRTFEAHGDGNSDSSDAHCDSLDSPAACRSRGSSRRRSSANSGRSSGASSISSSSCREAVGTEQAQTRAAVINEIIQALSSVSFEGSADLKPSKPVKQVEITRNINDDSVSLAQTLGQTTMAPNETCVRQTNPPCRLPPPPITSTAAADAAAAAATTSPATTPGHLVMPAEMTQSLHRASSHFKRSASSTIHDALRSSRSCNDLNGNLAAAAAAERDQAAAKTRRQVVREVSGPMFKNSHSQTAFRVEPIGVLWEMASHDPLAPHALPIFAEVRVDRKTEIFRDERRHRHRRRRPRGGSLEDNNGNDESTTSDDSMLFTSDKGVGPDETFDDELRAAGLTDLNTTADSTLDGDQTAENLTQRSRSEERGIAWEILLNSAAPHDHMTLQEAFDAHCGDVKERSLSRLEKVAQIKLLRYDRDRIFEQYANMLPAHQKVKLDKDKVLFVFDDNQCVQQQQQQQSQSPSKTLRKRAKKQNNSLEKRKKSNRIVADIYKHRVRREVLAGKTTFPVSKIMLC